MSGDPKYGLPEICDDETLMTGDPNANMMPFGLPKTMGEDNELNTPHLSVKSAVFGGGLDSSSMASPNPSFNADKTKESIKGFDLKDRLIALNESPALR